MSSYPRHIHNDIPFLIRYRLHGQTADPHQGHPRQSFVGLDASEGYGLLKAFISLDIDGYPGLVLRGRILVLLFDLFRYTDDIRSFITMIEQYFVAFFHSPQMKTRGIVANAAPNGLFVFFQLIPTIRGWFRFDEPISHIIMLMVKITNYHLKQWGENYFPFRNTYGKDIPYLFLLI